MEETYLVFLKIKLSTKKNKTKNHLLLDGFFIVKQIYKPDFVLLTKSPYHLSELAVTNTL